MPARGPNPIADLVYKAEDGLTVTYGWRTDVHPAVNGKERRIACGGLAPHETYSFSTYLEDDQLRVAQSKLMINAAQGAVFGVPLVHEAATILSVSGSVLTLPPLTWTDWAYTGQRVALVNRAENTIQAAGAHITAVVDDTITLSVGSLSAFNDGGSLVCPLAPCYLHGPQKIGLYAKNLAKWDVNARAILRGNATGVWAPAGATVTMYAGSPVYDRRKEIEGLLGRALVPGSEIVDRGGKLGTYGPRTFTGVARQLIFTLRDDAERQWLKKFCGEVRGRQRVFYLPTWTPDFPFTGDASSGSLTFTASGSIGLDYVGVWQNTGAHDRVQLLKADGSIVYRQIVGAVDNGNGTQTVTLDSAVPGALSMVSFLERYRLDHDAVSVVWSNFIGSMETQATVVQQ